MDKILFCFANLSFEKPICWIVTDRSGKMSDAHFCGTTINPLAPELFFKFLHTLYLKCE
jgi:hypothetical protein